MSDTYQAIYDAVRSRIGNLDTGSLAREIARKFDISLEVCNVRNTIVDTVYEYGRPSVVYRPTLSKDGDSWLAIYGDLPTGVVGCGDTPAEAMADFDKAWTT